MQSHITWRNIFLWSVNTFSFLQMYSRLHEVRNPENKDHKDFVIEPELEYAWVSMAEKDLRSWIYECCHATAVEFELGQSFLTFLTWPAPTTPYMVIAITSMFSKGRKRGHGELCTDTWHTCQLWGLFFTKQQWVKSKSSPSGYEAQTHIWGLSSPKLRFILHRKMQKYTSGSFSVTEYKKNT